MVICLQKSSNDLHKVQLMPLPLGDPLGLTPFKLYRDLWHQKTRVTGLAHGTVRVILHLSDLVNTDL